MSRICKCLSQPTRLANLERVLILEKWAPEQKENDNFTHPAISLIFNLPVTRAEVAQR